LERYKNIVGNGEWGMGNREMREMREMRKMRE
jgi:hypothetical protein